MEQNVIGVEIRWPGGRSDFLNHRVQRQLPFAVARALTQLSRLGGEASRAAAGADLDINQKRLLAERNGAIRSLPANKRDWPNVEARVAVPSWADFMVLHSESGVRTPRGRAIAVPTRYVLSKRSASGRIPKSWQPRTLLNERGASIDETGALRLSRKRSGDGLARLSVLYHFRPRGRVPKRWRFRESVQAVIDVHWSRTFLASLDDALASANR